MNLRIQRNRQGTIIALLVFLLPLIVLIVGFTIDVAYVQRVRAELRSASDLAAKAAAATLSATEDETAAKNAAIQVAAGNSVAGQPLTLTSGSFTFGNSQRQSDGKYSWTLGGSPVNAIRVLADRRIGSTDGAVPALFGRFYGHPNYQPVAESFAAFVDVDICLVLDRSGSMKWPVNSAIPKAPDVASTPPNADSRWIALDAAVRTFFDIMTNSSANEKLAMVTFATDYTVPSTGENLKKVNKDQDLTYDISALESALDVYLTKIWSGGTDIEAGIEEAKKILTSNLTRPNAEQIMIVFTDGVYTANNPTAMAQNAADQGIIIHTITFSDGADQTLMQAIATLGGGSHYHADTATDLEVIFREVAASLAILID